MFAIIYPGYFDPLLQSPLAPYLFTAGFILETIGFFTVWKIAQNRGLSKPWLQQSTL